jgi:2,5-diketo-D-gluconate reductase A
MTSDMSTIPDIKLNDGTTIPQLGFGVFQVEPEETQRVVEQALEVGYRHIDTAQMYRNEAGVGRALAASGIPRDELYVTTKLNNGFHRPDDARRAFGESLERLGLDHVDLFLIHWPLPTLYDGDFESTWRTLGEFSAQWGDGRATSVGVSNFEPEHLRRIIDDSGHVPAVNQVEVHPYFGNEAVRAADESHGIATEAWSPIAQGAVLGDPTIGEIARRLGRTPAQVTLRWHVQRGDIVFPKSVKPERMRENFALFDFELTPEDMAAITSLDRGPDGRQGANPHTMAWVPSR